MFRRAATNEVDKILGLEIGADDYIVTNRLTHANSTIRAQTRRPGTMNLGYRFRRRASDV